MHVKPDAFPVLLLLAGLGFELLRRVALRVRPGTARPERWRLAAWLVHPWTLWAAFNLVFRWRRQDHFNQPATFPFFANPWVDRESWYDAALRLGGSGGFWLGSLLVAAACAVTLLVIARVAVPTAAHRPGRWVGALVALGALLPAVFTLVPTGPRGFYTDNKGPLAPWFVSGGTMLHCTHHVRSVDHYLRNFEEIQPRLRISVHGLSHPPLASLSLYVLGKFTGARAHRGHIPTDRLRYALALTAFNALAVAAVYWLARGLYQCPRTGLLAAALWTVKPAALAHNTFAQDGVYTVFFVLALAAGWRLVTAERPRLWLAPLLGFLFFVLTQLTFSWCILTTLFALFAGWQGWRRCWPRRDWIVRLLAPLTVLAVLLFGFCWWYGLDYLAIYRTASTYVAGFYVFPNAYQWTMALLGGQLAILLMLGALVASFFCLRVLPEWWRTRGQPVSTHGLLVLGLYLVPILIGPACLKMETERCWSWVTAVALAGVAAHLAGRPDARRLLLLIAATNLAAYYGMRLFVLVLS